jgi:hypothetical protein
MKQAKPSPTRGRIGPYYKVGKMALLDGRRAEAQFIRKEQTKLVAAVGGEATPMQRVLIERAAYLRLRIHQMEAESIGSAEPMTAYDHKHYLGWHTAYGRLIAQIHAMTPKRPDKPAPPSLAELHAEIGKPNAEHR